MYITDIYFVGSKSGNHGSKKSLMSHGKESSMKVKKKTVSRKKEETYRARSPTNNPYDADESDSEELPSGYHQVPIQVIECEIFVLAFLFWWSGCMVKVCFTHSIRSLCLLL